MHLDIKLAIVKSGRYQYDLARTIGVSEQALSKFLRGHGMLPPEKVQELVALLGVPEEATRGQRR